MIKFLDETESELETLLMTARQLAKALSISERKLYDITYPRGTLRSLTLTDGGRPYYSRATVVEWIASRESQQAGPEKTNSSGATSRAVPIQGV